MTPEKVQKLLKALEEIGWDIAIPETDDDVLLEGFIIGKPHYIETILKHLPRNLFNPETPKTPEASG